MIEVNDCAVICRGIRKLAGLPVVYSVSPCEMMPLNLLLSLLLVPADLDSVRTNKLAFSANTQIQPLR